MAKSSVTGKSGPYLRTAALIKKIKLMGGAILLAVVLGLVFWSRQAQPTAQGEASVTLAPATITPTSLPTQAEVVEDIQHSYTPTAQATAAVLEPINWGQISTVGLEISKSYVVGDECVTIPAGWIPFTPNRKKESCEVPIKNLGDSLVLPTGIAVVPGYKLPEPNLVQTAATGDELELPWEVNPYWLRYKDTPEKLVRVCLLQEDNEITNTRSIELVVDEDLSYKPTGGGKCITALAEDVNLVVFSFLNEIYNTIESGDYKYYEIVLDHTIQGGQNQEVWLGGKPLTNK